MSTEAISPLRQRMIEDMNSRKLGAHTQRSHIYSCKRFAAFLERSPDTATLEDIRLFQLHLAETGISICNRNRIMTGVRFLLRVTLRRFDLPPRSIFATRRIRVAPARARAGRRDARRFDHVTLTRGAAALAVATSTLAVFLRPEEAPATQRATQPALRVDVTLSWRFGH